MSDQELIAKFLAGDIQAFNTLVWRWQKPIYNFVLKYLNRAEDAKDVTQRTFIKVHTNLSRLQDTTKFSSWIYQIALNQCRDESKKRKRRLNYSLDELKDQTGFDLSSETDESSLQEHNPERLLHRSELEGMMRSALDKIPEEQKTIVIMKEYQGLKFSEIADVLGLPINTVKSRLYYGLKALRKLMEQWNIDREMIRYEL